MDGRLSGNWRVAQPANSPDHPQNFSGLGAMQPPLHQYIAVAQDHINSQSQAHPQYNNQVSPSLTPPATPSTGNTGSTSHGFGRAYKQTMRSYNTPPPAYQPLQRAFEAIGDPDDLIRQIPEMDFAVADFNSVTMNAPPFRDIPSVLIAHLNRPNITDAEPGWERLLWYFLSSKAHHGHSNLQDLYIFVTRIALPNIIITNRGLLLAMYLARRDLPSQCRLRYDSLCPIPTPQAAVPSTSTPPPPQANNPPAKLAPTTPTRPIFRSRPTPTGTGFLAWLHTPPNTPPPHPPVPAQMAHRKSEVDAYLIDDEIAVRGLEPTVLLAKTAEVLKVWWRIVAATRRLEGFEKMGWEWIEGECEEGGRDGSVDVW